MKEQRSADPTQHKQKQDDLESKQTRQQPQELPELKMQGSPGEQ